MTGTSPDTCNFHGTDRKHKVNALLTGLADTRTKEKISKSAKCLALHPINKIEIRRLYVSKTAIAKKRFSDYPPNVPRQLIRALRAAGSIRKLEKEIGVNNYYICKLLNEGIEPSNPIIREKMFFKMPKPRKPRSPYAIMPRWWERTPEALQHFVYIRNQARIISNETRVSQYAYKKGKQS